MKILAHTMEIFEPYLPIFVEIKSLSVLESYCLYLCRKKNLLRFSAKQPLVLV